MLISINSFDVIAENQEKCQELTQKRSAFSS